VRESLRLADWVSLKVDAVSEEAWRRISRPHPSLRLGEVLQGMLDFAETYDGALTSETMLIAGVNDGRDSIAEISRFLEKLQPSTAYLGIPTRPPCERWAASPDESSVIQAFQVFSERLSCAELLTGCEGMSFVTTGSVEEDLLSITSVHPMREDAVKALLAKGDAQWSVVEGLIEGGFLAEIEYQNQKFYLRRFQRCDARSGDASEGQASASGRLDSR
jgi:wyosine [tRNA(Phe)-imidazoG37] synthetase (radical SAM superfamily)